MKQAAPSVFVIGWLSTRNKGFCAEVQAHPIHVKDLLHTEWPSEELWSHLIRGCLCLDWEGNGNTLQYSYLENSMDRGVWWAMSMGSQRVGHDWEIFTTLALIFQFWCSTTSSCPSHLPPISSSRSHHWRVMNWLETEYIQRSPPCLPWALWFDSLPHSLRP